MIKELTEEQRAKFPEYVEKWTKIGLCTEPADRPRAENGIRLAYEQARLTPPPIRWADSPVHAIKIAREMGDNSSGIPLCGYGQHDCSWLSYYDYFGREVGLSDIVAPLQGLMEIAESAGWFIPYDEVCIISERPNLLMLDDRGRMHNTDGPAIRFPDGYAIYAIHGVVVPEFVIEDPSKITVKVIEEERNAEVRRVMVERYGQERYLEDCKAKKIHSDEWGTLYKKAQPGDEDLLFVKVVNSTAEPDGTFKNYFIRVNPELRPLTGGQNMGEPQKLTALNAVASTFGMTGAEYANSMQFMS